MDPAFELDSSFSQGETLDTLDAPNDLASLDSLGIDVGDVDSDEDDDEAQQQHRSSLAFELATASDANGTYGAAADVLAELGISEEAQDESEEDEEPVQSRRSSMATSARPVTPSSNNRHRRTDSVLSLQSATSSPGSRTPRRVASLAAARAAGGPPLTEADELKRATMAVEQAIDAFAPSEALERALAATSEAISSLVAALHEAASQGDRQEVTERHIGALVRTLATTAAQREEQTRELAAHDVSLVSHINATVDAEALSSLIATLDEITAEDLDELLFNIAPSEPMTPTVRRAALPTGMHGALAQVRESTTRAVTALGAINEHTQVNSAVATDAGRKIRALKTYTTTWKEELEAVERAEEFIEAFEQTTTETFSCRARACCQEVETMLDEGSHTLRKYLSS